LLVGNTTLSVYVDCPPALLLLLLLLLPPPPPPPPGPLNVADTVVSEFIATVQVRAEPQLPTLQPPKTELPSAHAYSVTMVPAS
jgi:hypothetical protein